MSPSTWQYNLLGVLFVACASAAFAGDVPVTPAGKPDFSGVWFYGSATPFERAEELGNEQHYSDAEAEAVMAKLSGMEQMEAQPSDPDRAPPPKGAEIRQEADHNFAPNRIKLTRIGGRYRTSLVVDPTDGRLPTRAGAQDFIERRLADGIGAFDHIEIRPASERCLNVAGPMAPMLGWFYNANMRIVQTDDYFMLKGEMLPPRIIAISERASKPPGVMRWEGESVAQWDTDVLRITTDKFRPEVSWFAFRHSGEMKVVEEFRLVSADSMVYRYTVHDPVIYTAPFTVEMSVSRRAADERIYEFACHEGNHSFPVILRGARVQERLGAE